MAQGTDTITKDTSKEEKTTDEMLQQEALAFDKQVTERINNGLIPDLRRLRKVDWFYNNVWRDPFFVKVHLQPKVDFVVTIAKNTGGKVLELGCGYGYLSLELARNGLDVLGVDISPKSIEYAQKFAEENTFKSHFGSLQYRCDNIISTPLDDESYDTIVFFGTLHHFSDIPFIINKVYRALKPGGNLIICEPLDEHITMETARFAALLRVILPTWIPHSKKMKELHTNDAFDSYVRDIFQEYRYEGKHEQSPCDNSSASEELIVGEIEKKFKIVSKVPSDAFINKIIGGLRGKNKYQLAKFLKFFDNYCVEKNILPYTFIMVHAIKEVQGTKI